MPTKQKTTAKGLGWRHVQARKALERKHQDGTPCQWCGRPLYLDRTRNWDYNPESTSPTSGTLHADHSRMSRNQAITLGQPIGLPDRLLHGVCNIQRGDGGNDHLATTQPPTQTLAMAWPW